MNRQKTKSDNGNSRHQLLDPSVEDQNYFVQVKVKVKKLKNESEKGKNERNNAKVITGIYSASCLNPSVEDQNYFVPVKVKMKL